MSWLARCAVARVVVALEVAVERVAVVFAVPHLLLTSHFIHFDRSLRHCLTHSLTHSGSVLSAECGVDRRRSHGPHAQVYAPILKSARRASHRR
jgi:hypothetical protein